MNFPNYFFLHKQHPQALFLPILLERHEGHVDTDTGAVWREARGALAAEYNQCVGPSLALTHQGLLLGLDKGISALATASREGLQPQGKIWGARTTLPSLMFHLEKSIWALGRYHLRGRCAWANKPRWGPEPIPQRFAVGLSPAACPHAGGLGGAGRAGEPRAGLITAHPRWGTRCPRAPRAARPDLVGHSSCSPRGFARAYFHFLDKIPSLAVGGGKQLHPPLELAKLWDVYVLIRVFIASCECWMWEPMPALASAFAQ